METCFNIMITASIFENWAEVCIYDLLTSSILLLRFVLLLADMIPGVAA
jgi:hypothetical protein